MTTAAELRALVLTTDVSLAVAFTDIAREVGIRCHTPKSMGGVPVELGTTKYEGVLLDFDTIPNTRAILACLHANPSNKNAAIVAVATGHAKEQDVVDAGVQVAFTRPFDPNDIRRALHAAYDAMARERRRYFRCSIQVPVLLKRRDGQAEVNCKTLNVSSNGLGVSSSTSFLLGEVLAITIEIEDIGAKVVMEGTVVWDDKHGKTGISFSCQEPAIQRELDAWLDSRFVSQLRVTGPKGTSGPADDSEA